jgi:hypothetical protein
MMPYRVELHSEVKRVIREWYLPDAVLLDVWLFLNDLKDNPARLLRRVHQPVDGMAYEFSVNEAGNRLVLHSFLFLVRYGDDEETLWVVRAGHTRTEAS